MKMHVRIYEHADMKPLALAVVSQAIRDVQHGDTIQALDAALWLTGEDFPTWAEVIGIPFADGYSALISGAIRRGKVGRK